MAVPKQNIFRKLIGYISNWWSPKSGKPKFYTIHWNNATINYI